MSGTPPPAVPPYNRSAEGHTLKLSRITIEHGRMDGVICIRGVRIPVATVVGTGADGLSEAAALQALPHLEAADVREALQDAAEQDIAEL